MQNHYSPVKKVEQLYAAVHALAPLSCKCKYNDTFDENAHANNNALSLDKRCYPDANGKVKSREEIISYFQIYSDDFCMRSLIAT